MIIVVYSYKRETKVDIFYFLSLFIKYLYELKN